MDFAKRCLDRDQFVLFPERLDEAISPDHSVRLLDEILGRVDWTPWEHLYARERGRPPIHPREIASVILYGIQKRIRSSRALEEAIEVRLDFRWLVHGRSIDHSTISGFRQAHAQPLKDLFIQIVLIARELGHVPLQSLGYDGTRMRASNRRSGTRTPEQLRQEKEELAERFEQLQSEAKQADLNDEELLGEQAAHRLPEPLADLQRRQQQVAAAIEELEKIEQSGLTMPSRLPITDPQSRIAPNKEGGYAPNYTPTATVDIDSGVIVEADVVFGQHEDRQLPAALDAVKENLGLDEHVAEVLADGLMSRGENLVECINRKVDLISPISLGNDPNNPAIRDNLSDPVAAEDFDRLPTKTTKSNGKTTTKLSKEAFVYDVSKDQYWCPQGQSLPRTGQSIEKESGRDVVRHRYESDADCCVDCPLLAMCVNKKTRRRMIRHTEHEPLRLAHAEKMASEEAQAKYARRRHPGERPFAMIKHHFGARRFLLRGRAKVRQEWNWLTTAFNLHRLMSLIRSNADPPPVSLSAS